MSRRVNLKQRDRPTADEKEKERKSAIRDRIGRNLSSLIVRDENYRGSGRWG